MKDTGGSDTDILIVGAGPVGLFLANECARRGLRCRLIEARAAQSEYSKALAIFPRTLEIFDMAGVAGPFLERANRVTTAAVLTRERTLARMRFEPEDTPYPFIAMVPQNVTEELLVAQLQGRGGAVEYETTFVSLEQQAGGVDVTFECKGERRNLTAAFVIGCDGAHSAVRHALNLKFEGGEYAASFMLADIGTDPLPPDVLHLCPSEFGPVAIFPMSATRSRVVATVDRTEGDAPTLELVQRVLQQRAPAGIQARSLHWSTYFRIHHRHAEQLRVGRVFIAGDAAHIHSPFGGQGMNTGLHDAWNLIWKLDLFLRGKGNEALLDSYTAERVPVIKNVIETTDMMTKALGSPNRFVQLLRDALIPMVSRLAPFQHAFVQRLSELGIAYPGSPIVEGHGERYFDDSLRGGTGISHRFLLSGDAANSAAAHQLAGEFSDVLELRPSSAPGIVLVRPDGYAAYSDGTGGDAAFRHVRSVLARQTVTPAPDAVH